MELLYVMLVLLTVTRLFGELAERLGQPVILGELISGIALGLLVHSFSGTFPVLDALPHNEVFKAITDLAIFFLMLLAGLEMHPRQMAQGSLTHVLVALGGMLLPLGMGIGLAWLYIPESALRLPQMLFIGTALAITAVPVSVKVLLDLGQLNSRIGRTIVSAAVVDDMLSLTLLAVLTALIRTGEMPTLESVALLAEKVALFFILAVVIGRYVIPAIGRLLASALAAEFEFSGLLITALFYAVLAESLGLHFILGAFFAGLFFMRHTLSPGGYDRIRSHLNSFTTGLFAPIFFASIGINLDLSAAIEIPLFVFLLIVIAMLGKLIGAGVPAYLLGFNRRQSLAVGIGMSARGAVELIIADIALRAGLFDGPEPLPPIIEYLFSAVVLMAVVTTLLTPLFLRRLLSRCLGPECEE